MHVLIADGKVKSYPYSVDHLRKDNPGTSFPQDFPAEMLASYGVFLVKSVDKPAHDPITQDLTEGTPVLDSGVWTQTWRVTAASSDEILRRKADADARLKALRAKAFVHEADPLFFQAQRGEIEMSAWQAKVDEIRARYPYKSAG